MQASLKRWVGRVPDLSVVIARFPVAVIAMAVFTVIVIIVDRVTSNESIGRLLVGLIVSAYSSVIITLAGEGQGKSKMLTLQLVLTIGLSALFYYSATLRLNLVMAVGAVLLLLGNSVLWRKSRNDLHVWDFTHKIWTGAIFAFVGSIIFTAGVFAIQAALKSLFGLSINELTERLLLPIGLGFLAPLYWLSIVPAVDEPYDELIDNPGFVSKAVAFLGTWLLSPLTLIYALILLAYAVKILLAGQLPKGEIAQLTTPFLLVGTLTWLVLEPPFIKTKLLARLFRKLWFPISIPAALMLAIAVFVRVKAYGFTPERVALCLIVLWALGLGIWFSFASKEKRDIRLVPGSGAALLLVGTVGSLWLSIASQYGRLDNSLTQAISKTESGYEVVDMKAAQNVKSAINYLDNKNADKQLRRAFSKIDYKPKEGFSLSDIYDDLGFEKVKVPSRFSGANQADIFELGNKPIALNGFDQMLGVYNYHFYQKAKNSGVQILYNRNGIKILIESGYLEIWEHDSKIKSFNLKDWIAQFNDDTGSESLSKPILMQDDEIRKIAIQPIRLQRWDHDNEDTINGNFEFFILLNGFKL